MKNISFNEACYELLKKVPKGKVTTYRELAHALGTGAYRAVGNAMRMNPHLVKVPCHRVVNSDGRLGGYAGGLDVKIELLEKEGVKVKDGKIVDFEKVLFRFD